jgi:DNA-binding NtrC family response regulator
VLPPLRSRREDLPLLVEHFCGPRATEAQRAEILALANQGAWLGNVRELRNFVERALVMGTGDVIAPATARRFALPAVPTDVPFHELREQLLSQLEREYVAALLAQTNGDTAEAARRAGLDRSYIYRLIRKHDL